MLARTALHCAIVKHNAYHTNCSPTLTPCMPMPCVAARRRRGASAANEATCWEWEHCCGERTRFSAPSGAAQGGSHPATAQLIQAAAAAVALLGLTVAEAAAAAASQLAR